MARPTTERVIVFIDWQNVYKDARDAFHQGQGHDSSATSDHCGSPSG
jgi:hypothetical protein